MGAKLYFIIDIRDIAPWIPANTTKKVEMIFGETSTTTTAYAAEHLPYGKIVVIKRSGQDSASFELVDISYLFGRSESCDIRIQIPTVSEEHCRIHWDSALGVALVQCLSAAGVLVKRGGIDSRVAVGEDKSLLHGDIITIVERSFRYETVPNMRQRVTTAPESRAYTGTPVKFQVQEIRPDVKSPQSSKTTISLGDLKSFAAVPNASNSPLKQAAVRTPLKPAPAVSAFVTSPLAMPAERQPLPVSPLQKPPGRGTPTKSSHPQTPTKQLEKIPSTPNNRQNVFVETVIEDANQQVIVKTPQKIANEFTLIEIVAKQQDHEVSSPRRLQIAASSPYKTTGKTPVKTPIKSPYGKTPTKVGTSPSVNAYRATPEHLNQQTSTPLAQIHSLDRITPGKFTPRPLDLDAIINTAALQVDAEIAASPKLSPRVSLIDGVNGVHYSPLSPASVLTPEQREAITRELANSAIDKVIGASRPLGILSPGTILVEEKDLVDVESPTKSRNFRAQELSLFANGNEIEDDEEATCLEEQEDFSAPLSRVAMFSDSADIVMEDAPALLEEHHQLDPKLASFGEADFHQLLEEECPITEETSIFNNNQEQIPNEIPLVDEQFSEAGEIIADSGLEGSEAVTHQINVGSISNNEEFDRRCNFQENDNSAITTETVGDLEDDGACHESLIDNIRDGNSTIDQVTEDTGRIDIIYAEEHPSFKSDQITAGNEDVNMENDDDGHFTPRRSSRIRKSTVPLSSSKLLTPNSVKRPRLQTSTSLLSEDNGITNNDVEETTDGGEIKDSVKVEENNDHAASGTEADLTGTVDATTTLRRSTRVRTPKVAALGRKVASTTSKKRKAPTESDGDDNSPLLRRNKSSSNLGSEDNSKVNNPEATSEEYKENKTNRTNRLSQVERKKVDEEGGMNESNINATTPHQLRRSTRVYSAKK